MRPIIRTTFFAATLAAISISLPGIGSPASATPKSATGARDVLQVKSRYDVDETVERLKADIAAKGIRFFSDIDQAELGAGANISIQPSRLLLFGNPPLGVQFLSANRFAGLDWPVRMLVVTEADGSVTVAWTDFAAIGRRYELENRAPQLKMASEVAASIASSVSE